MGASRDSRYRHRLRVVPQPSAATRAGVPFGRVPRELRSQTYVSVLREISRRIQHVHRRMLERGDILPEAMPEDRELSELEVEELAWRVYCLACITRTSLVRCMPTLLLLAAEWLSSTEPDVWDAYCEASLP